MEKSPKTWESHVEGALTHDHGVSRRKPKKALEVQYARAFKLGCPPAELQKLIETLMRMAIGGDVAAAKLLLDRALPIQKVDEILKTLLGNGGAMQIAVMTPEQLAERKEIMRSKIVS